MLYIMIYNIYIYTSMLMHFNMDHVAGHVEPRVACILRRLRWPGFAFVHYETEEAAKDSMEKVNGMQIAGGRFFR